MTRRAQMLLSCLLICLGPALAYDVGDEDEDGHGNLSVFGTSTLPSSREWNQPLLPVIQKAAKEYQIPIELMLVLGRLGSAFENRGGEPTMGGGYGPMALRENRLGATSLVDAASLIGADAELLKVNPVLNIRGAAAILDYYAQEAHIDRSNGLDEWWPVVVKFAGLDDECNGYFAWEVYSRLSTGFKLTNSLGETFAIEPQLTHLNLDAFAPPSVIIVPAPQVPAFLSPDYPAADWDSACSPDNYSTKQTTKDTIVIHITESTYGEAINTFKNCSSGVSSHYIVAEDGRITQMVREAEKAYHAGCYNSRSIGIEHEGYTSMTSHPPIQYDASAALARKICDKWGIPKSHNREGPGIVGHADVTYCCCGTHTDPGVGWDWRYYIDSVRLGFPCRYPPEASQVDSDSASDPMQLLDVECADPSPPPPPSGVWNDDVRRPFWQELKPPAGESSPYPDYQNVSTNLKVMKSLQLLASILTRGAQKIDNLASTIEILKPEARCNCTETESCPAVTREDCCTGGTNCLCTSATGVYPLWLSTDLFKNASGKERFALKFLKFLDRITATLHEISATLALAGQEIKDFGNLLSQYLEYVDRFTEGYHLGGYSEERPDLHLCVGYGGHGAFAEMANLFGEVSIGSRYTSHNLSKEHRAQFRSGGFAVDAFGRTLSILPGIESNLQIDGFKMWDAQKPFGIDFGTLLGCDPNDPNCCIPLADVQKYDIFNLVDQNDAANFDTTGPNNQPDGCLQFGEFISKDFYKANYEIAGDLNTHTWPRDAFEQYDWEKQNTAVFGAGLNLPLHLKQIVKCIPSGMPPTTPLCPGKGITLYPGPPTAKLFIKFTLDAGADWKYNTNGLRDRLKESINKNLPVSLQLAADNSDFERPMHFLQAPDLTDDDTSSAFVKPHIAGDLLFGIELKSFLRLGITATIGLTVDVEPAAHGGVYDLNVALADTLLHSNPPATLPCDPILETTEQDRCSNELFHDLDTGVLLSSGTYSCATTEEVVYHCKEPEQGLSCTLATAEQDCPQTHECVAEYGCTAHGYCSRQFKGVEQVTHDMTYAACSGDKVCTAPAVNVGAACDKDADCPGPNMCVGGLNNGQQCNTNSDCNVKPGRTGGGECKATTAPCVAESVGYFTPYQCLISAQAKITGWQGPGCHPLTVGFPSACGCQNNNDCVPGQETCVDGKCFSPCDCDPDNPTCGSGRTCVDGACLLACANDLDCAVNQTCTANGVCVNPYGIPFAEQIVWQMTNTSKPQHAVGTYAMSEVLATAILDFGLRIGLDVKIFKNLKHFDVFKFTDAWVLGQPINKIWYQPGLEAQYQNDCDPLPVTDSTVTNWQPGDQRVNRYNPQSAPSCPLNSCSYGNAGTESDLLDWCQDEVPYDVWDADAPTAGNLSTAITDTANWGEDIGLDIWGLAGACVSTQTGEVFTELPFTEWVENTNTLVPSLMCQYTYPRPPDPSSQMYTFSCGELGNQLLLIWGCLNVAHDPHAAILASHFDGVNNPLDIVALGGQVLDLNAMLIDPTEEFNLDNLKDEIRYYGLSQGVLWYSAISQCWDAGYLSLMPGDVQLVGVDVHPCCGNGSLDTSGCGPITADNPGTPCEECDDGNNLPGDGCSPFCRLECHDTIPIECGDGIIQIGLGEQCDGTDDAACLGQCQLDCTCPPSVCGNGIKEPGEECDGLDNETCLMAIPSTVCKSDCTCGTPNLCGNGDLDTDEECDPGSPGVACVVPSTCHPAGEPQQCTCVPFCGNNHIEADEECDGTDDAACPGLCYSDCTCPSPQVCQPTKDGSDCLSIDCPGGDLGQCTGGSNAGAQCTSNVQCLGGGVCVFTPANQCLALVARVEPAAPTKVIDCDCLPQSACHIVILANANCIGAGAPNTCCTGFGTGTCDSQGDTAYCTGDCPPGQTCVETITPGPSPGSFNSSCCCKTPTCVLAPSGTVVWYTGDDTTPTDILGQHNGTYVGFPVSTLDWQVGGGALEFHSPDTYVTLTSPAELDFGAGDFSIDMWIKTTAGVPPPSIQPILDKRTASPIQGYHMAIANGNLLFQLADVPFGPRNYTSALPVPSNGNWHFIAATVDRGTQVLTLYVDGSSQPFSTNQVLGSLSNSATLLIGARRPSLGLLVFDGLMDEIEFFNRALTQSEVDAIRLAGSAGKCKCTPLPDGSGCTEAGCHCFGECINGGYCDDPNCCLNPDDCLCYAPNHQASIKRCGNCFGECIDGGYCDNPNPDCCINPDDCVCYSPNHPVSIYLCGDCFGECIDGGYCDHPNPDCCIEPGNCLCYSPDHPVSIKMCGERQECRPTCINYDPVTQVTLVTDCDCRRGNECHATVPGPGEGPPECIDGCPAGESCEQSETTVGTCVGGVNAGIDCLTCSNNASINCTNDSDCGTATCVPNSSKCPGSTCNAAMEICCRCISPPPEGDPTRKSRFLSFSVPGATTAAAGETALRVNLVSLHHVDPPYTGGASVSFTVFEGQVRWVGPPTQYVESVSTGTPFYASFLQCNPHYQDWSTVGLLHVFGSAIVPSSVYEVENVASSCQGNEANCAAVSAPLSIATTRWGDVVDPFNPPSTTSQPDFTDIGALVNKFKSALGAPIKAQALLAGTNAFGEIDPGPDLNFTHISACVDAFKGLPYPYQIAGCP